MSIDIEALLKEISPETPCGEDLSYDTEHMELERLVQGTPEQQVGDELKPAEEPNWNEMRRRSEALLSRGKNLRIVLYLTLALLKTEGLFGLRDGLALLRGLLDKYWDDIYPLLDKEDDNPALERINVLASLSPAEGSYEDHMRFKQRLLEAPLSLPQDKRLPRVGLRDILIASGELSVPAAAVKEEPPADDTTIDSSFATTSIEDLQATAKVLEETCGHLKAVDALLTDKVGAGNAPDLSRFITVVQKALQTVGRYLAKRGEGSGENEDEEADEHDTGTRSGAIRSTKDVMQALERICVYYDSHEPSSPIPLLLRRAQRLVDKKFLEIIEDLSPDAMKQVQQVSGEGSKK